MNFWPPLPKGNPEDSVLLDWFKKNERQIFTRLGDGAEEVLSKEGHLDVVRRVIRELAGERGGITNRHRLNDSIQSHIARNNKAIEFCRSGEIKYSLFERTFGQEKTVDVNLSLGMVLKAPTYDTAIIVSGDQDYVPAVQEVKNLGKHVINVSFLTRQGKLLPGGARRLNEVTDWSLEIPYDELKMALGLTKLI